MAEPASPPGSGPPLLRPLPRRPFELQSHSPVSTATASSTDSFPPTPSLSAELASTMTEHLPARSEDELGRTRSIVNLTKSTLFGIYEPTADDLASQPQTPWGTGAETPVHWRAEGMLRPRGGTFKEAELERRLLEGGVAINGHEAVEAGGIHVLRPRPAPRLGASNNTSAANAWRVVVLFACGLGYGALIAHLHDNRSVAPVRMEGLDRENWRYLAFWGAASVVLGLLLPWVDTLCTWEELGQWSSRSARSASVLNAVEWNDVVRSVGSFIGIAFAIRKTPWSSPLQLSATLSLANPFLWYLVDRTASGFVLSTSAGLFGVIAILILNPSWVPSPSHTILVQPNATLHTSLQHGSVPESLESVLSPDRVGLAIWIGSVFFCSCICFGNIGRLFVSRRRRPSL